MAQKELPKMILNRTGKVYVIPSDGKLLYKYQPFYNLKIDKPKDSIDIESLRLTTEEAGLNIDKPIDIDIEESYDGSANLVLNDGVNPLKIVNPRFYLIDSHNYRIGDRKGNLDTNIYTRGNFKTEANLIKTVQSIVKVEYKGLSEGGSMPVGSYTFYFKLADSDGNESDFVAESGKVVCHIGNINQPRFIRGGQINENSGKSVNFKLSGLDLAYNYINIYYARTSGDNQNEFTSVHKIDDKFKIQGINTEISITGSESIEEMSLDDINIRFSEFDSVKTTENCQNITFAGGITNEYDTFRMLENYSLWITPQIDNSPDAPNIGSLTPTYTESFDKNEGYEYYNTKNIYYKLGYWDQEIYRIGIVYILNDYTLSPVFNIRGIKELSHNTSFDLTGKLENIIEYQEDYIIKDTKGLENAKGVFKINTDKAVFSDDGPIKPIGLKFTFNNSVVEGDEMNVGLKDLTKGFFFVRQQRIPTILAQSIGIATTKHGNLPTIQSEQVYLMESFLRDSGKNGRPRLGVSTVDLKITEVTNNALLCPEADLRAEVYNSYFNSSEYILTQSRYQPSSSDGFKNFSEETHYSLGNLNTSLYAPSGKIKSSLLLVEPGIELIKNNDNKFSSKAGDAATAHANVDVRYGDYSDPSIDTKIKEYNESTNKIRGLFNTYIGSDYNSLESGKYYNIYQKDYDFNNWKSYFNLRYNDSSPFSPISDRMEYSELTEGARTPVMFRGDCYINTFTHRMNWNFIDPELPTSNRIVDIYTWYKNFRVVRKEDAVVNSSGNGTGDTITEELQYNKLLPLFTYKRAFIKSFAGEEEKDETSVSGLLDPNSSRFKKYSDRNGTFGYDKLNRPDINAVGLGQWVTYKICSNINLAMRDVDLSRPSEEALHGMKRSFYPLQSIEKSLKLPESNVINKGISKTMSNRYYFEIPDVPFIKTSFPNRIHYSNILQQSTFVNGNRVFLSKNYQDYSSEYGALVKLVEWYGTLMAIMEHGVLQIPVNERAMMKNESGENVYINTDTVLPKNPKVLSNTFGSLWPNTIVKTSRYIYGLDTVGKKIWRTDGQGFEIISDLTMQKFLNDNIDLKESDRLELVGSNVLTTHYNAFKSDIMFTYKYGKNKWHICWNEILNKWVTRYSWYPEFSENINNIFYTFANKDTYKDKQGILYKHGFAGTLEEEGKILPTKWYDKQESFEFEFVVAPNAGTQKIYDNFEIISNNVEPNSFIYEIIGDSYDWSDLKSSIESIGEETKMLE